MIHPPAEPELATDAPDAGEPRTGGRAARIRRIGLGTLAAAALVLSAAAVALDWSPAARAAIIGGVCIALWLSEWVPVWVPTLVLWSATPLLLGAFGADYHPLRVLAWSADPVLVLFFGGFALAAAASRQGADRSVAALALRLSHGHAMRTIALAAVATAALSMWMSNIAAAALMLAAFGPVLDEEPPGGSLRRGLLLAIALAADVGGIATPIGSGPNGIAIAAAERYRPITFVHWMAFGVPLTLGLVAGVVVLVAVWIRPTGRVRLPAGSLQGAPGRIRALGAVFGATVALWLTEPLHGVRAWVIALAAAGALLVVRLLRPRDLLRIDWATLVLIAGGIALGALMDRSGLMRLLADALPFAAAPPTLRILALCLLSASLSALMSNTGAATLLVPLAMTVNATPSAAVLVAVAASLGVPFVISTPPNAMAFGAGLRARDLLVPGLIVMLAGCAVVALTGPWVLRALGVP
ncbi:MAG TPA: SLC13 family permease [Longimicrobium sp.]|nr:SLC13 family permease [Longimicrobium sp.]